MSSTTTAIQSNSKKLTIAGLAAAAATVVVMMASMSAGALDNLNVGTGVSSTDGDESVTRRTPCKPR